MNPTAQKLRQIIADKQTNLCVSADLTDKQAVIDLIHATGEHICVLKTHADIITEFDDEFIAELQKLKKQYNFLIFEDRKFADIGNTVQKQYEFGVHKIVEWADIINAHCVPGPGIIEGLKEIGLPRGQGLLLLAEMTSAGSLATGEYTNNTIQWGVEHNDFVMGVLTVSEDGGNQVQAAKDNGANFLTFTTGVKLANPDTMGDSLGQQYQTPQEAVAKGADVIIVGRGIYQAEDPTTAAIAYKQATRLVHQ